jgi:hypothetical protein
VETHNVMSTEHKNSADMRLCIDALEVLYTRPEIHTFVLVAGDRDYIPLVQHLRRQGRNVYVSSFRSNVSGDLLQNIAAGHFIDAFELLNEEERREIEVSRQRAEAADPSSLRIHRKITWQPMVPASKGLTPNVPSGISQNDISVSAGVPSNGAPPPVLQKPVTPSTNGTTVKTPISEVASGPATVAPVVTPVKEWTLPVTPITDETTKRALMMMLDSFGQHHEIWLSPLLRKFSNEMPLLADFERKVLLANLESAGAIRIVKRQGNPFDYSAVLINYNHPTVRECIP